MKAAMQSPITIAPVHSSSSAVNGSRASTCGDDVVVAQDGAHICQLMYGLTCLQLDIGDPFYDQLTAVKSRYLLTSTT